MALQQNNQGPVGYGQPGRRSDRRWVRPEDEEMFGRSPEVSDAQEMPQGDFGQGQPPNVYPQQPPGIPQAYRNHVMPRDPGQSWGQPDRPDMPGQGAQWGNYGMPGRTPVGENQYSQQAYQTRTDDPFIAGIRNQMSTPMDAGGPPAWQQRNGGFNPQIPGRPQGQPQQFTPGVPQGYQNPGTSGPVDPRFADPRSGYGPGGVNNPAYQAAQNPQGYFNQGGLPGPQPGGDLAAATRQSIQNNYTDIAGMRDYFKPGQFMGQLEGFNTNSWGTGERGSDTLKNMMGTIFSNYDVSQPGALQRALPDIQKALPGATIVEHPNADMLDPDGPNGPMQPVDVIRSAVPGGSGAAWQWGVGGGQQGPQQGPGGPAAQAYFQAMPPGQSKPLNSSGVPEVTNQNSASDFLEWLMQQQQQGQMPQYQR